MYAGLLLQDFYLVRLRHINIDMDEDVKTFITFPKKLESQLVAIGKSC